MDSDVMARLEEIRGLGAIVETAEGTTTEKDILRAEAKLGFPFPTEYREFLLQFGELKIELERTWNFYGLKDALRLTTTYRKEFDEFDQGDADGPYYPKRFIVIYDEGDYSNAATGTVYDADLDAFLETNGGRWVDREDAFSVGYWGFLLDELDEIHERLADSDDILVAGGKRDIERRQKARDDGARSPGATKASSLRNEALERLYAAFEKYPHRVVERFCDMGKRCKGCKGTNKELNGSPLREIRHDPLFHFAYNAILETDAQQSDYKHFIPRIVELLDELSWKGNPSVVIAQIFRNIGELTPTPVEELAVETVLLRHWEWLLHNPATKTDTFAAYLQSFARWRDVAPLLEAWTKLLNDETALGHVAAFATAHYFDIDAAGHGWDEAPFATLRAWLFSKQLKTALVKRKTFGAALEAIEHGRP